MCTQRGIPAATVDGFLPAHIPVSEQEAVIPWHTAVQALADCGCAGAGREVIIDWTARQFDPVVLA